MNLYLALQSCEIRIFNGHLGDFGEEEEVFGVITRGRVSFFSDKFTFLTGSWERILRGVFFFCLAVFPLNKD